MPLALDVENLTCIRANRVLFRDLNFSLAAGALLSIEGPNGVGKSSLLRLIAGFLRPVAGVVRLRTDAGDVTNDEERSEFVAWVGHHDAIKPQMSVRELLNFHAQLYRAARSCDDAMASFGLTGLADVPGQFLSAGQKRRVALARAVLAGRPLWLLDEPLAALDAAGKRLVAEAVGSHCGAGGLVLAATHEPLGLECEMLRLGDAR